MRFTRLGRITLYCYLVITVAHTCIPFLKWERAVKKDSEQARLIGSCNNEFLRLIDCHNGSNLLQVNEYLQVNPFTARQTPENEIAYERLMDVRLKLYVS